MKMGIIDRLKSTEKGKLSYRRSASGNDLENLLHQCSSSPELHVSPKFSKNTLQRVESSTPEPQDPSKHDKENKPQQPKNLYKDGNESQHSQNSGDSDVRIVNLAKTITSPEYGKSQLAIHKYEEEQENKVWRAKLQKQREFEENRQRIQREADQCIQQLEQHAHRERLMMIQDIVLRHESQAAEIDKSHQLLKQTHEERKQAHDACIQEAEKVRQRMKQEELRKKQQQNKERQDKLTQCTSDLKSLSSKIQDAFNTCKYQNKLTDAAKKSVNFIQTLAAKADAMCKKCQDQGEVTPNDLDEVKNVLDRSVNAYEFAKSDIDRASAEGKKEAEEAAKQAKLQQEQQAKQQQAAAAAAATSAASGTSATASSVAASTSAALKGKSLCVDLQAFQKYTQLQDKMKTVDTTIQVMSSTAELKKLKFDILKAVNTPINAISPVSGDHLRDKLKRLLQLLSGQTVEVSGRNVTLNVHPQAPIFCQNLIAKMIVRKGEEQVSSRYDSAFAIAMVAVGLWREKPELGDLFLAHFYEQCPYLVPYYKPKQEGQSAMDYFKSRGYLYEDGVVEKQDKFLKRMSGIMRLYFSMLVSSPPRGTHPHGVDQAWIWLVRVLNMEPEPDITTTMIYDCLQVTGHALWKEYSKQFHKLLYVIVKEMFPKLKNLSSGAGGGALSRLEILLQKSLQNQGQIPKPDGYLEANFWTS